MKLAAGLFGLLGGLELSEEELAYFISWRLWHCCAAWTRAAAEASVRELLLSPRFLKVLVALKAAHKSSTQ